MDHKEQPQNDLGAGLTPGGAGTGAQEPSSDHPGPVWVIVRATVPRPGLQRGEPATVDITNPDIQQELRSTWIIPLPADQQPPITTGTDGNPSLQEATDGDR